MRKLNGLLSKVKISTFINIKISAIVIFIICSSVIGINFIKSFEYERTCIEKNIEKNIESVLSSAIFNNELFELNNLILTKSLGRESDYDSLSSDIDRLFNYVDILFDDTVDINNLYEMIDKKHKVLYDINTFEDNDIDMTKAKKVKSIEIVSVNKHRKLFKTKIDYDTLVKEYSSFDKDSYIREYNKTSLINSNRLNSLIKINNELTLSMKLYIDIHNLEKTISNFDENRTNIDKLDSLSKKYVITIVSILILVILFVYLLFIDIIKIKNSNKRGKNVVDILLQYKK